jgi:transcriptional regulator with XRE-family HTH domain
MPKAVKPSKTPETSKLTPEALGLFVKARRTQSGLRLEDAAALCGVAKETYSKIERGHGGVRLESVLAVCQKMGVELVLKSWKESVDE